MAKRDTHYLQCIPKEQAWRELETTWYRAGGPHPLSQEVIPVTQARGRVLARALEAVLSAPHYHASAMDGIATRAIRTQTASLREPVVLAEGVDFHWVDTGDPLPPDCDAVIMIEDTHQLPDGAIEITEPAASWQHVRVLGEDIVQGELVLPAGRRLGPFEQGALMASGQYQIPVQARPRVAVIPTGDELVMPGEETPRAGQILEFNSTILTGQLEEWGAQVRTWPIGKDDPDTLAGALEEAVQWGDLVLINAGSSAGRDDYTARVIARLGQVVAHGVAIRPGTPVILGLVQRVPVLGIPGYPVSTALASQLFAHRALSHIMDRPLAPLPEVKARLTRRVASPPGREEYLRVQVARVKEEMVAVPGTRGAGNIKSLAESDGYVVISLGSQGLEAGTQVAVSLYRDPRELERSLLLAGSHDLSLDLLAAALAPGRKGWRLVTSRVGSLAGLLALKRGEAHLASSHLLDPETGEYNLSYVRRYLSGQCVTLVEVAKRQQGLVVKPGNPQGITGLEQLVEEGISYVNRQRGAGTRVLLDYELGRLGLDPQAVDGYGRELFSHMAVAQAVAAGAASTGMAIKAAAEALHLDFIPVSEEVFQLVIPAESLEMQSVKALLDVLATQEFRARLEQLGGYNCSHTGEITEVR